MSQPRSRSWPLVSLLRFSCQDFSATESISLFVGSQDSIKFDHLPDFVFLQLFFDPWLVRSNWKQNGHWSRHWAMKAQYKYSDPQSVSSCCVRRSSFQALASTLKRIPRGILSRKRKSCVPLLASGPIHWYCDDEVACGPGYTPMRVSPHSRDGFGAICSLSQIKDRSDSGQCAQTHGATWERCQAS